MREMNSTDPLLERLQIEFADRQAKNPRYSLRAFARDLDVSLTSVSLMLKKQRKPSTETRQALVRSLALPPTYAQETKYWYPSEEFLQDDQFRVISEWAHLAILNLVRAGTAPKTNIDLQRQLDLPAAVVAAATERLKRLGLIQQNGKHFARTIEPLRTKDDVPSSAIRKLHSEALDLAKNALVKVPVEKREYATTFMMIRPAHIAKAKELIRKFRSEMAEIFDAKEEVAKDAKLHVIAVQMYPLE